MIGGFRNNRILIRKRINGAVLADVYFPNVLSPWKKQKFVFEINIGGDIYLYSDHDPYKPLVTAFDPNPITLEFLSFRNLWKESLQFWYGNAPTQTTEQIIKDILSSQYGSVSVNPLLTNWNVIWPKIDLKVLTQTGKYYESWSNQYINFVQVTDTYRPFGYRLRFPVYISGSQDANILLSSTPNPTLEDDVYEITLGWRGNSLARISKRINGVTWVQAAEQNILSPNVPVKVICEVSNEGVLKVFTSYNPWAPLLTATDVKPIDIRFVSFSSSNRVQFWHDVNEEAIIGLPAPVKPIQIDTDFELVEKHPLLNVLDYPIGLAQLFFQKYYKVYVTTPAVSNKYVQFIQLSDLTNVYPDGYIVQVPFYIRGSGNAHVLLASKPNPTPFDDAYELVIGGYGNSRIILRKRISGAVLADVWWPNVISDCRQKKFIFEVTVTGDIRLFSDANPRKPLLVAYDPTPIKLQVLSFKNYLTEKIEFFWGNNPTQPLDKIIDELLTLNYGKVEINPLFVNWKQLVPQLNLQCKYFSY